MHKAVKHTLLRLGGYPAARFVFWQLKNSRLRRQALRYAAKGRLPLPSHVMIEPTQRCNLACRMCYQQRARLVSQNELSLEQMCALFDRNPQVVKVTLIGGEPFMRPDTIELVQYLDRSRDVVICTNGTLLGEREWNAIAGCRRIQSVCISLDGPREIHENIRGAAGCYERTCRTIAALAPYVPVTVNVVLQHETLEHLDAFVETAALLGVKKVKLELERLYDSTALEQARTVHISSADTPISSHGRSRNYPLTMLEQRVKDAIWRGGQLGVYVFPDPPYLMSNIAACYSNSLRTIYSGCTCHSFNTATVAPDGTLLHCLHLRKALGSLGRQTLDEAWNTPEADSFRRSLLADNLTPLCENCPFLLPGKRRSSPPAAA